MYTGPGQYMRNIPPLHVFKKVLEQRGLTRYAAMLQPYFRD
jgi:hypothetical protein